MQFLEAAGFLNAPVLAGRKVNGLYDPGLASRLPPQPPTAVWALKQPVYSLLHKTTNEPVFYIAIVP